jgi:hypothetical protein
MVQLEQISWKRRAAFGDLRLYETPEQIIIKRSVCRRISVKTDRNLRYNAVRSVYNVIILKEG